MFCYICLRFGYYGSVRRCQMARDPEPPICNQITRVSAGDLPHHFVHTIEARDIYKCSFARGQKCRYFAQIHNDILLVIGVADTFWLFIFKLNRAKKWFNSIFNSKLNQKYSFNWKNNFSLRKQWKTCKMGRFFLKTHFLFIFLVNIAIFWFIQKFIQEYGKNIHSKNFFIQ